LALVKLQHDHVFRIIAVCGNETVRLRKMGKLFFVFFRVTQFEDVFEQRRFACDQLSQRNSRTRIAKTEGGKAVDGLRNKLSVAFVVVCMFMNCFMNKFSLRALGM
jgi:hypothetical protein